MQLVSLAELIPDARIDLRYTTSRNVLGRPISDEVAPRMALEAAQALARVASELRESGYSLVIWDAYRTPEAQRALLGDTQDERYVLEESNHCRGQAVDVTLARTQGGGLLDMGTDHDYFGERAHLNTTDISDEQRANRQLLVDTMERQGFSTWPYEWWHFDYAS